VVERGATDKVFGSPQHPYTQMLLASVPRLDEKWGPVPTETRELQSVREPERTLQRVADDHYVER
jgi:peptide/nickel transport system ATP-binding protein